MQVYWAVRKTNRQSFTHAHAQIRRTGNYKRRETSVWKLSCNADWAERKGSLYDDDGQWAMATCLACLTLCTCVCARVCVSVCVELAWFDDRGRFAGNYLTKEEEMVDCHTLPGGVRGQRNPTTCFCVCRPGKWNIMNQIQSLRAAIFLTPSKHFFLYPGKRVAISPLSLPPQKQWLTGSWDRTFSSFQNLPLRLGLSDKEMN